MTVREIRISPRTLEKLVWKHRVTEVEIRQVLRQRPKVRRMERGKVRGEDLYSALGRTEAGRYLIIFFIHKTNGDALIVTARDMSDSERKRYGKK